MDGIGYIVGAPLAGKTIEGHINIICQMEILNADRSIPDHMTFSIYQNTILTTQYFPILSSPYIYSIFCRYDI